MKTCAACRGELKSSKSKLCDRCESYKRGIETGYQQRTAERDRLRAALGVLLGRIDYSSGMCQPTDLISAVVPPELLALLKAEYRR